MEDIAGGKRKLIDAALRLAAARRSFAGLGLRELAREAGLNPNTFYRHFRDMEDLALTAVAEVGNELRPMLRAVRWAVAQDNPGEVATRACDAFFVGVCGSTGPQPALREAVRQVLADIAGEMAEDIERLALCPGLSRPIVDDLCGYVVSYLFHLSTDYLEDNAKGRRLRIQQSKQLISWLLRGAAEQQRAQDQPAPVPAPARKRKPTERRPH
ncbi:TetR family transcriptional regulator [Cupriavidus basilensis]|uniref:TetR family transcriptional regulator n=1 Tax=Cupriavidus basilensis TaxID=68895 RepID=UPI0028517FD0|nr:TetR family transcriptional regulator [Cupriavidus basilensis]MDR3378953.1 TetR family transcriptional regulator [Cupriavidus basilensis]